ncbi:DoxX family protein [Algoriphagus machipongonensis]|uniref:DoxX family protein n=1 Tax=Algoriphagus machipongonensis TaxID=388413 RepID=A3HVY7_9BACT|nr:DoxX family protein [Algoriphagus machipongonensis]EAZ82309.1 DoxX family protein [Algoriphagus machipongonensis]
MNQELLNNLGKLVLRLGSGALILTHGIPKISRLFGEGPIRFSDPFGLGPAISLSLATFAEVICAVLIIIGLKTRLASIPLMITMLTAALYAHADDPFGTKEKPLLFFVLFLGTLILGAGDYSIDGINNNKKRSLF